MSKGMFVDTKAQGRFFQALIGFIFTAISAQRAYTKRLKLIALSHCRKGVKAVEYGIIGEVMFWSLKTCLEDLYDKVRIIFHRINYCSLFHTWYVCLYRTHISLGSNCLVLCFR